MTERARLDLPRMSEEVVYSEVTDGGVLLATEDEVHYGLDAKGARVWELLPECATLDELCGELQEEFPEAGDDDLRRDVLRVLADLADRGLVRWADGSPGRAARGFEASA